MYKRLKYKLQAPEGDLPQQGGGEPGAGERTNDPTPSIDEFDWDSEFKAVSDRLDKGDDNGEANPAGPEGTPAPNSTPAPTAPVTPPAGTPPGGTTPADHNTFPKSWAKDLEPVWGTIPEAARQQIHKREQDVLRGINYYKQGHDFSAAVAPALEPYKDLIQEGVIEPKTLVTNLLRGHYLLANSDEDKRVELFKTLMDQYGVPAAKLVGGQQAATNGEQIPPGVQAHIDRLTSELNAVKSQTSSIAHTERQRQQQIVDQQTAQARDALGKITSDEAKYPFANELLQDMYRLVASGAVTSLEDAYEQAKWVNPSTRVKLINKEAENQRLNALKARQASGVNVVKQGSQGREIEPETSLDETLESALKKIRATG